MKILTPRTFGITLLAMTSFSARAERNADTSSPAAFTADVRKVMSSKPDYFENKFFSGPDGTLFGCVPNFANFDDYEKKIYLSEACFVSNDGGKTFHQMEGDLSGTMDPDHPDDNEFTMDFPLKDGSSETGQISLLHNVLKVKCGTQTKTFTFKPGFKPAKTATFVPLPNPYRTGQVFKAAGGNMILMTFPAHGASTENVKIFFGKPGHMQGWTAKNVETIDHGFVYQAETPLGWLKLDQEHDSNMKLHTNKATWAGKPITAMEDYDIKALQIPGIPSPPMKMITPCGVSEPTTKVDGPQAPPQAVH